MDVQQTNSTLDRLFRYHDPIESSAAQVLMSMAYDTTYNICQYPSNNPLHSVTMHDKENYEVPSGLYRAIERFERHRFNERFNLTLIDYLSLPRDVVDTLTKIAISLSEKYSKMENEEQQKHKEQR